MAYTTIDNPELYFQTKLYSGNGSNGHAITFDGSENMSPDWVWIKSRSSNSHRLTDSVRGATKVLYSDLNFAEVTDADTIQSFDTNGFTIDDDADTNGSGQNFASWNWSAGGSAPAITYSVKVVSDSGNKYRFDDFGTSAVTLDLQEGGTYTFDQSDSSNSGHPLRFSTTSNGTHGGGSEYTTGVTTTGTPGSSGAKTVITVAASAPTLYYYCTQHSGMGGQANTNSTFGSSNFSGSVQTKVSANTTAGFSICTWTSTGSAHTVGHGLADAPSLIFVKTRHESNSWLVYHHKNTSAPETDYLELQSTVATADYPVWNDTAPTSSVFNIGTWSGNDSSGTLVGYCFAEKKGYSKMGEYRGSSGTSFIYTGFKPAFLLVKSNSYSSGNWRIYDNKRSTSGFNVIDDSLRANTSAAEIDETSLDFVSNGFKYRANVTDADSGGTDYIYMAFAESPFVNSNGVPTNAR